jgi:epoxyqueuosine reductase QueG
MSPREHPSIKRHLEAKAARQGEAPAGPLDSDWVRRIVTQAGADDVGLASIDSPELKDYRDHILTLLPGAKTCISVVMRMNPHNVRSPFRQQYELEYHHMYHEADQAARRAVAQFQRNGVLALDVCSSYPMNMENWPGGGMWYVAHKPVAAASGRGRMGLHHMIVHPRFGACIALSSILLDRALASYDAPLDYDPCVRCMLCVTSCPVGAIQADGFYNAINCTTHSYRDKYGGFTDFLENVAHSKNGKDLRRRLSDQEIVLMWQSLAVGSSYKCTNCMAVCPGGDDLIGPYAEDREEYMNSIAKPLQDRKETIYVVKGSDADAHVRKRFPHKKVKYVHNGVRAASVSSFLENLHILFQREQSKGLNATYQFTFSGEESLQGTVTIRDRKMEAIKGLHGTADVRIFADSRTWLRVIAGDAALWAALLTRKIRIKGPMALMKGFARCFPS